MPALLRGPGSGRNEKVQVTALPIPEPLEPVPRPSRTHLPRGQVEALPIEALSRKLLFGPSSIHFGCRTGYGTSCMELIPFEKGEQGREVPLWMQAKAHPTSQTRGGAPSFPPIEPSENKAFL